MVTAGAVCALVGALLPSAVGAAPGVTRRTIKIGVHAPITGAVPLPSESVDRAARVFWRWLRLNDRRVNGRNVRVILRNDQTSPATAVAACKEMVEDLNVFMLAGTIQSGVPYQAEACARYAESVGVPYVSLGMRKGLFNGFDRYFAISKTYRGQVRLLADYFADQLQARGDTNGFVYSSATDRETTTGFTNAMSRRDVPVSFVRSIPKNAGTSEARLVVQEMQAAGVQNVFFHHTPIFFMNVLKQADTAGFRPQWTGIDSGATRSDQVVDVSCAGGVSIDGARFLSPLPAFVDRDGFDRRHDRAMRRIYGAPGDSVTWLGWATSKALKKMLEQPGRRLTRARFERTVERSRIRTGILPSARFRPWDHFGGRAMHLLKAECSDRRWHTARRFVRDF